MHKCSWKTAPSAVGGVVESKEGMTEKTNNPMPGCTKPDSCHYHISCIKKQRFFTAVAFFNFNQKRTEVLFRPNVPQNCNILKL